LTPPYRIETARVVARCWQPTDAAALKEALDPSVEHLRPWLPWAYEEPKPLAEKVELLRSFRGLFDLDQDHIYGIFERDESRVLGGTGLHTRLTDDAREIGYWIRQDAEGHGYITETVSALARVGFELVGLSRIEIRCHPDNHRSAAVPRRLGFRHVETVDDTDGEGGDVQWNFEKFLISPSGEVVGRFRPTVLPDAPEVIEAIEANLPA